jgi:hypothetical protein
MNTSSAPLTLWCRLKCDEAPEEAIVSREAFLKVECNIVQGTNYMESGIKEACLLLSISVSFADIRLTDSRPKDREGQFLIGSISHLLAKIQNIEASLYISCSYGPLQLAA